MCSRCGCLGLCVCVCARARVCLCSGAMMLWCSGAGPRSVRSACSQLLLWCSVAGPCSVDLPAAWLCLGGVAWPAGHLICWQVSHRTAGAMTALWLLVCAGARFHASWKQRSHSVARLAELAGAAAVFGTCARTKALLVARHVSVRALPCLALFVAWLIVRRATPLHCVSNPDGKIGGVMCGVRVVCCQDPWRCGWRVVATLEKCVGELDMVEGAVCTLDHWQGGSLFAFNTAVYR
jgi:hypothetical protein